MDRLISEKAVLEAFREYQGSISDFYKAIKDMPSVEPQDSEDKIIRRTLENFMHGLWEEIQVGELEYTTSEVYEMLEREIFTDNHVAISSKNTEMQGDDRWLLHFGQNTAIPSAEPIYYPPCEDCHKKINEIRKAYDKIQLVESKTGHWIDADGDNAICGCCNRLNHLYGTYCKHCGARMIEEQEVRDEE